ncbi:hypothetical protein F5Y08DRAFT_168833 [Xylaria arbuscula]|nr:hypothetical protein F5Y08DRAFT_168833 [Xylaria arbuscula]
MAGTCRLFVGSLAVIPLGKATDCQHLLTGFIKELFSCCISHPRVYRPYAHCMLIACLSQNSLLSWLQPPMAQPHEKQENPPFISAGGYNGRKN